MKQYIALVDESDNVIGYEEKHLVHRKGLLHRAFSIIVFNSKGEMLLHRRALDKYHSPGLWTNTCCSHLQKGIDMDHSIHERLLDEMGFDCNLKFVTSFHYQVDFGDGMAENEIDHIYVGLYDGNPNPNPGEVCEWAWVDERSVSESIKSNPESYSYWFKNIYENYFDIIKSKL